MKRKSALEVCLDRLGREKGWDIRVQPARRELRALMLLARTCHRHAGEYNTGMPRLLRRLNNLGLLPKPRAERGGR